MTFVYFIRAGDIGPIKIGMSRNVESRLAKMQTDTPMLLKLLGCIPGGKTEEHNLHLRLSAYRVSGEWFRPDPVVIAAVERELASHGTTDYLFPRAPFVPKSPLQAWRMKSRLSLNEFAKLAETNAATISRVENNLVYGTVALHFAIFRATNGEITPNDLAPFMHRRKSEAA
jgi:hypothetical protein